MEKTKVLEKVKSCNTDCSKVMEPFIKYFMDCVEHLYDTLITYRHTACVITRLEEWLDKEGLPIFLEAIEKAPDKVCGKVKNFAALYQVLLKSSWDNSENLLDLIYNIPGQFDIFINQGVLVIGSISTTEE